MWTIGNILSEKTKAHFSKTNIFRYTKNLKKIYINIARIEWTFIRF